MTVRTWQFVVHDARARPHRGVVVFGGRLSALGQLGPGDEFRIVLLDRQRVPRVAPESTAVCVPAAMRLHAVGGDQAVELPDQIEALTLTPHRMSAYAAGTIVTPWPTAIAAGDVFPVHSERPRLDRLALALIEGRELEDIAVYTAVIRHELGLAPGADPVFELEERLDPPERRERPPAAAPGIMRLKAALAELRRHERPAVSIEQFGDDLRLLRLFARDDAWPKEAMERLLTDVQPEARGERGGARKVVPLRPPAEDT